MGERPDAEGRVNHNIKEYQNKWKNLRMDVREKIRFEGFLLPVGNGELT